MAYFSKLWATSPMPKETWEINKLTYSKRCQEFVDNGRLRKFGE